MRGERVPRREVIRQLRAQGFTPAQAQILWEEGWAEQVLEQAPRRAGVGE